MTYIRYTQTARHVATLFLSACVSVPLRAQAAPAGATIPDSVRTYVVDAISAYKARSVHRSEINWDSLQTSVLYDVRSAQTPADTWGSLTMAFRRVDRHSFLIPSPAAMTGGGFTPSPRRSAMSASTPAPTPVSIGRLVLGKFGLVTVLPHSGLNRMAYVDSLHAQLESLDSAAPCGWIVDLRRNTGGNMWPMLAGVGALTGNELVGSFTTNAPSEGWRYRNGRAWTGVATIPTDPQGFGSRPAGPTLRHAAAPVAVLLGRETASSGEMIAIAFAGRRDVRSFGDSTSGFSSANVMVPLRDGAQLVVTNAYPRDRLGRRYALQLVPDEFVASAADPATDAPVTAAAAWLERQKACRR